MQIPVAGAMPFLMAQGNIRYRGHIDGLRAIAVMGVVLFHFGANWLPGGFVGVDVFFVISGFLISRSIFKDAEAGTFSYMDFYERRARRILPALFVVTALTSATAYIVLYPSELVDYSKSVIASLLFSGNIFFWWTADYFGPSANKLPLLHYWSLGVEEQFYIFFPFLALSLTRVKAGVAFAILISITLISLIFSQAMLAISPQASFYLLPFRAFELLVGSILAKGEISFPKSVVLSVVSVSLGLLTIIASMIIVSEDTAFPGISALAPCIGACLVIWGADARSTWISDLLGRGIFSFIGKISYSLYLVHWPIAVFSLPYLQVILGVWWATITATLISTALAWMSFCLIEQPVRTNKVFWNRTSIFRTGAVLGGALASISLIAILGSGFPGRLDRRTSEVFNWQYFDPSENFRSGRCFLDIGDSLQSFDSSLCLPSDGDGSVIFWGDSSIAHYFPAVLELSGEKKRSVGQITSSQCAPIVGQNVVARPLCKAFNDMALAQIAKIKPSVVVMGAMWMPGSEATENLSKTIKLVEKTGAKVIILGEPPIYRVVVPTILANRMANSDPSALSGRDLDFDGLMVTEKWVSWVAQQHPDVLFISILQTMCPERQCTMKVGDMPMQFDALHLTPLGSKIYAEKLFGDLLDK
ncbi:acyltransferase family protein [Neorhizobium sp. JUb45]|uniref:acyltransferase family protein n=1 Tax=Neorhizobium sp. JUb45 TaxID=2485113 RepID=UPI001048E338|nr:acyltransferase family protein [Neorhizobium sp. JUb45]TCR01056.1 peptidoglycan/LPS O-acetylase OafA/YrhL [Neorhizobium sp. JUb45]